MYYESVDGISWSVLPTQPNPNSSLFTSDGILLAGAVIGEDSTRQAIVWRWANDSWVTLHDGTVDLDSCGTVDLRNGAYFDGTEDAIIIDFDKAEWVSSQDGWECVGAPNLFVIGGHGVFVGSGNANISDPDFLWFSEDGNGWRQTQPLTTFMRVATVGEGFVVVDDNGRFESAPTMFSSRDGEQWTERDAPFASLTMWRLASDGSRAVIIEDGDNDTDSSAIWVSSTDGATWTRYELPFESGDAADSVAILSGRIVVTGANSGGDIPVPSVWVADIP